MTRRGALFQLRYMLAFQLPGAAARAARDELAAVDALWRAWSPGWTLDEEEHDGLHLALRRPGTLDAALQYYRAIFSISSSKARRSIALLRREIRVPGLVLYGERDGCLAPSLYPPAADRAAFPAGLELRRVARAGHFLHQERPEVVNEALVAWLKGR